MTANSVNLLIDGEKEVEIGFWIAREFCGMGDATESAQALLAEGERILHQRRFISLIQPENEASRIVAEKIGMEVEKEIVLEGRKAVVYSSFIEGKNKMNETIVWKKKLKDESLDLGFSGVVYLKQGNHVLSEEAFGYANRTEERLNTVDTRFGIASGCKLFTAIAVCQMVDQGIISFDTPLSDCLDIHFPRFDQRVTIHHLLTHQSGIPDYFDEEVMDDYEDLWKERPVYQMKSLKDFLPLFQSEAMKFSPGERFHYNNAGYILLGLMIEQQTGTSFTDYVEGEIFNRVGMRDSGYFAMDQLPERTAIGYIDSEDSTFRSNIYSIPAKGGADGGAFITAPDMIKLWEALFDFKLLMEETTRKLLTPHVVVNGEVNYGYGLWMNKKDEDIYKYHVMGYDPGVSFRSSVYPALDLKLVIPSNKESGPFEMTKAIEDRFFNGKNLRKEE